MDDIYIRQPWMHDFEGIQGLPPGMLGHFEASLLYHLARDVYRGLGDIVDAGAFLGASSFCFTRGVEANAGIAKKAGRIHAYDIFQVWSEPGGSDAQMAAWLQASYGIELAGYESTVGIYTNNLGSLARYVRVHQGDILETKWSGRPIEFLFVDICKVKEIWLHLLEDFFPSLIPGVSLVIHQDWHHPWLPYLHVAQEALADYFELEVPRANDTTVFRLIDRIPERVLARVAAYDFTPAQELELFDRAIARFAVHGQARFLRLAKAELLRRQGRFDDASREVHDAVVTYAEPMTAEEKNWFEVHAASVADGVERDGLSPAPLGFEESYMARHPEVVEQVAAGVFKSGRHHWFRHGRWLFPEESYNGSRRRLPWVLARSLGRHDDLARGRAKA